MKLNNTLRCSYFCSLLTLFFLVQTHYVQSNESTELTDSIKPSIYIIPISETVEPGMAAFIKRAVSDNFDHAALFIFEIDTFGGRVDSALQIVDTLLTIPKEKSIAYIKTKAISAGALISLACGRVAMKHNTTIGDCAPISFSTDGPEMLGEKFQSPLRAKFRAIAKRNGYPETLSESMVTLEIEVYQVKLGDKLVYMDSHEYNDLTNEEKKLISDKKTIVSKGELLTMNDSEAKLYGFSMGSFDKLEDLLSELDVADHTMVYINETWSESFVRWISVISPILMMIGFAALYMEFQSPGFGLPGIIGLISLSLVFFSQYLVGLASYTELLIIIIGIFLLGFEVFVLPGFGISGITGFILIFAGLVLSLQDFTLPNPSMPWQSDQLVNNLFIVTGSIISAFFIALFVIKYIFPGLNKIFNGPYLTETLEQSSTYSKEASRFYEGSFGIARTSLRPSGKACFINYLVDVMTEGEFIEKGTQVVIHKINQNRIIVRAIEDV